jgi:hypothetical protein
MKSKTLDTCCEQVGRRGKDQERKKESKTERKKERKKDTQKERD